MDLTKITTPFGLLDEETQDALKAWPHGVECFDYSGWEAVHWPTWAGQLTYRALPVPPREFWVNKDGNSVISSPPVYMPENWIHVREVTDGEAQ